MGAAVGADGIGEWSRYPRPVVFEPADQTGQVGWVEADRASDVNRTEFSTLDQSLHGARMDPKQICCFVRRQERRAGKRGRDSRGLRLERAGSQACLAARLSCFVAGARPRVCRLCARWLPSQLGVGIEEHELTSVRRHEKLSNL